jgi:hypothetical protein
MTKMREVPRDDKWQVEREANDARRDAYEVTGDADTGGTEEGFSAGMDALEGRLITSGPSEEQLVIVALLMRLYDVNMALLSHFDKETADRIFDESSSPQPGTTIPTQRTIQARKRKYHLALSAFKGVFVHEQTYIEFISRKNALEFTTYFRLLLPDGTRSEKYRFDYEMSLVEKMPSVKSIRETLWWTMRDWQKTHGVKGNATAAIP